MIEGTIGYLPPESLQKRSATAKSDVFSFGIVVLEVVSGRRTVDLAYPDEEIVLLDWVRRLSDEGKMLQAEDGRLPDGSYSLFDMQRLTHLGLLCSLNDPQSCPTMKWVMEALSSHYPQSPSLASSPLIYEFFFPFLQNGIEYAFFEIEYMSPEKRETGQVSCVRWSCAWKKEKVVISGAYESLQQGPKDISAELIDEGLDEKKFKPDVLFDPTVAVSPAQSNDSEERSERAKIGER
ncbi:hypothetical protein ACLOJK_029006 [Asimina triloba]